MAKKNNPFSVPSGFMHCLNASCQLADTCLRYRAMASLPKGCKPITIVNPAFVPSGNRCPEFLSIENQQCAYGIDHLYDDMKYATAVKVKEHLIGHFGKNIYYRFMRKEKCFTPEHQQYIQEVFRKFDVEGTPRFDTYEPCYKVEKV